MSDLLPPDLPRLRTLEHWLTLSLDRVRARIAEVEAREASLRPVRQRAERPGWVLSYLREGGRPVADSVHIDGCRPAARHQKPPHPRGSPPSARRRPRAGVRNLPP
nr:hypothetical protein [Streptomyces venezuelae]